MPFSLRDGPAVKAVGTPMNAVRAGMFPDPRAPPGLFLPVCFVLQIEGLIVMVVVLFVTPALIWISVRRLCYESYC